MIAPISLAFPATAIGSPAAPTDLPAAIAIPATRVAAAGNPQSADGAATHPDTRQGGTPGQAASLEDTLQYVNMSLQAWSTGMRFDMDHDAQRLVISITDSTTGKVLRTIPSDAVLRVARMIVQLQGAQVDTHA